MAWSLSCFLWDGLFMSSDWPKPSRCEHSPLPFLDSLAEPKDRPPVPAIVSQPRDFNVLDVAGRRHDRRRLFGLSNRTRGNARFVHPCSRCIEGFPVGSQVPRQIVPRDFPTRRCLARTQRQPVFCRYRSSRTNLRQGHAPGAPPDKLSEQGAGRYRGAGPRHPGHTPRGGRGRHRADQSRTEETGMPLQTGVTSAPHRGA